jgi:hypothetical protein
MRSWLHGFLLILAVLHIIVAMNAEPHTRAEAMTNQQNLSNGDNSSTDSLNSRINRLRGSADWWNKGYLISVVAAVVITVLVGGFAAYFQYTAVKKARLLADSEAELGGAKENLVKADLTVALRQAADAIDAAREANVAAEKAHERAGNLEKEAESARLATEELRIKSEKELEIERRKRLALAVSLLPRRFRDQLASIPALKAYAGMTAVFEYIDQDEPLALAQQIYFTLEMSGWHFRKGQGNPSLIRDGVFVHPTRERVRTKVNATLAEISSQMVTAQNDFFHSVTAANALRDALVASGIDAKVGYPDVGGHGTLIIRIGKKPDTAALLEALRELGEASATHLNGAQTGGNKSWFK